MLECKFYTETSENGENKQKPLEGNSHVSY